jgi:hypothetical protein
MGEVLRYRMQMCPTASPTGRPTDAANISNAEMDFFFIPVEKNAALKK